MIQIIVIEQIKRACQGKFHTLMYTEALHPTKVSEILDLGGRVVHAVPIQNFVTNLGSGSDFAGSYTEAIEYILELDDEAYKKYKTRNIKTASL